MAEAGPTIEVRRAQSDPGVPGLPSADWAGAQTVKIDRYWSGEKAPLERHAEARLLWSSKALYIKFDCQQNEPLVVSSSPLTNKKTIGLWDRDVCEIFIAPDPNLPEQYLEFEAAPTGEWLDVAIQWIDGHRQSDWDFRSQMTTATKIEQDRLTIAMRIPWDQRLREPKIGEHWRANLFRCVGSGPERGYLAWQPTHTPQPNFHVPQAFGWLAFQ